MKYLGIFNRTNIDAAYEYDLMLVVTSTTTLKFLSAGSCPCQDPTRFGLGYNWNAFDCYVNGINYVYEEIIEVEPDPISLRYEGYFSISNAEPTPEPVAGDFDGDGDADVDDYNALGNSLGLVLDTNHDSIVDFSDLLMVINDWGTTCSDHNPPFEILKPSPSTGLFHWLLEREFGPIRYTLFVASL